MPQGRFQLDIRKNIEIVLSHGTRLPGEVVESQRFEDVALRGRVGAGLDDVIGLLQYKKFCDSVVHTLQTFSFLRNPLFPSALHQNLMFPVWVPV